MKNVLLFSFLFVLCSLNAQDRGHIYMGIYTGGFIETYHPSVTAPYFKKLKYYSLSFYPKLGYQYKNVTAGIIGSYSFHKNSLETLEPIWGYGYFVKYHLRKKNLSANNKISIRWFIEWIHVIHSGYYVRLPDYWHRAKINSETTYLTGQVGLDLLLPKSFSIGLGIGYGSTNYLKDYRNLDGEKIVNITPIGHITLQYNLKLSKNKIKK